MKSDFKFSNLCGTVYKQGNVIFTPDGNSLISPVGNRVTVFDLINNKSITLPFETSTNIVCMDITPNGNMLFVADEEGHGVLMNLNRRFVLHRFNFKGRIRTLKFSPNGKFFAYTIENEIQLWRTPGSHRELTPFIKLKESKSHFDTITCLSWSPDSRYIVTGSTDMSCKIFPLYGKKSEIVTLSGHKDSVMGCYFSNDMKHIYTISKDGVCCDWEYTSIREILVSNGDEIDHETIDEDRLDRVKWLVTNRNYFNQAGSKVISVAFHPLSNLLLVGFSKGIFGIWQLPDFANIHTLSISQTKIDTVSINCTGEWLAFGTVKYGQLLVWEWQSETYVLKQQGHYFDMNTMSYSADGQNIATGGQDGKLKIWDTASGFSFVTFSEHQGPISQVEFTKQGQVVVSASLDGTVRAFDLLRYRNFRTFTTPDPVQFSCLAVDPSGEIICAGSIDTFEVFVWSMQTGKLLDVLSGHEGPISCMAFSPIDNMVATGSWDGTVRIWDAFGRGQSVELLQVDSDVLALTYSPDGKQIAAASLDGQITFWDPSEGQQQGSIEGRHDISGGRKVGDKISAANSAQGKSFNSLCYTADGKCIIGGGNSKYVCIYDCSTSVLVRKFQITYNKSLDGTQEMLNSKFMTEAGALDTIDDQDDDPMVNMKYRKEALPGVAQGDLSVRRTRPEARTKSVRFSPTGRSWAAASTEGLLIYSLDDTLLFDPFDLEIEITPESVLDTLKNEDYLKALVMSFRLNEKPIIKQVLEKIPPSDIPLISPSIPSRYLESLLKFLANYAEQGTPHLEFLLIWCHSLFTSHAQYLKQNIASYLPSIRGIQKVLSKLYGDLSNLCEDNLYLIEYLGDSKDKVDMSNLNEDEQGEPIPNFEENEDEIEIDDDEDYME
ncbi:WD repeat protein [Neoconidiobolus thromboides FSU 785]|nr:WD repeat protein [Neoconidiobolus thromboides FSU 785]